MFGVGSEFKSYIEFEEEFEMYKTSKELKYDVASSRLLKSTAKQHFDDNVIDQLRYSFKRYRCSECSAALNLRQYEKNGNNFLRITSMKTEHEHTTTDKHQQIHENLKRIKRIVGKVPDKYVTVFDQMIQKVLEILLFCQVNGYAVLQNTESVKTG